MFSTRSIEQALRALEHYLVKEGFKGYDPYDILNSKFDLGKLGKYPSAVLTQLQKRNPLNVRPLMGVQKEYNPKAMGLFLMAYSKLYRLYEKPSDLEKARWFYRWLLDHPSRGYDGLCWGYNFSWANPGKVVKAFSPNIVVTGFIAKGLMAYAEVEKRKEVLKHMEQIAGFVLRHLEQTRDETGVCFSYTTLGRDVCYNASLQAGEVFAWLHGETGEERYAELARQTAAFVLARQKADGRWNYSQDISTGRERVQLDFHQGYILDSLQFIAECLGDKNAYRTQVLSGLKFYLRLFNESGRACYRYPAQYPADIHNQSQGIISFSSFAEIDPVYREVALKVLEWTLNNMRSPKGYFYYKKYPALTIKTPYIRWSQAWMFLALVQLLENLSTFKQNERADD